MESRAAISGGGSEEWRERLGRIGFVGKAVLYAIIGIVAIAVALGDQRKAADQTGALASLGESGAGTALLVALAIGLAGYATFRAIEVFIGPANESGAKAALFRAASAVRALVYGVLCVAAVRLVADAGGGGGSNEGKTTSTVFDLPAGVALVGVAGVVLIGVALYQAYKALSTSFEDDLDTAAMGSRMRSLAHGLGIAGHAARAIVYALIGGFLIKAAAEQDSSEAVGLDGALQEIAQQSFGALLLGVVAVGLFLYGAYCLVEARYGKF